MHGTRSEISFNLSEAGDRSHEEPGLNRVERELMNIALATDFPDPNHRKIDSKDSLWKPAPLIGREIV